MRIVELAIYYFLFCAIPLCPPDPGTTRHMEAPRYLPVATAERDDCATQTKDRTTTAAAALDVIAAVLQLLA